MVNRIVRMEFREEHVQAFVELFIKTKPLIEKMPGCHGVSLFADTQKSNVMITYSYWESEDMLNDYRMSDLFRTTWQLSKSWFAAKPLAWSMVKV
jgi:heme-degrading monooxygenase HmoA